MPASVAPAPRRLCSQSIAPAAPARLAVVPRLWPAHLMDKMTNVNRKLVVKNDLIPSILASDATIIVTIGAGDIGELVPLIKKAINETF